MLNRGFIYCSMSDYDCLSRSVDLTDWAFYLSMDQTGGPSLLAPEITINGITESPIIALYASDATTGGWVNRGSLGGTLTAVNIRAEDLGHDTPFTDGSTAVRFHSVAGGTRRYYQAPDAAWGDIDLEDFYYEAIYSRDMPAATASTADAIIWTKRNESSSSTIGYTVHSTSSTTNTLTIRPTADAKRTAAVTTTARSWSAVTGWLDMSDTAATGCVNYLGSATTNSVAHTAGSLTNALIATIGDAPNWGAPNALEVNFKLVYFALYKRTDWLPGGADNATQIVPIIRQRQMVLAGMVPQKGTTTPLNSTWSYHQSQRVIDGYVHNYSCGIGFACPNESILGETGLPVKSQEFNSATPGLALTETFAGFGKTNTTTTASLIDVPQNPTQGIVGQGISFMGDVGTSVKTASVTVVALSTVARRCLWQVYFKGNTAPYFYMKCPDSTSGTSRWAWYNCATGATTLGAGVAGVKVQACQDGWFRAQLTFNVIAVGVAVTTDMEIGFSDTDTAFDLTSDGTTIDGWAWGIYYTFSTAGATTYPPQFFNYSGGTASSTGPLVTFDGADVTAAPYTLWVEMFSRDLVQNSGSTVQALISYTTDATNFNQIYIVNTALFQRVDADGGIGGAFQWQISGSPSTTSGDNNASSGKLITSASSCDTNDIKLYASDGTLLGSDAAATVPTAQTNIRIGSTVANNVSGRGYSISRTGIKNGTSTDSSGPV